VNWIFIAARMREGELEVGVLQATLPVETIFLEGT